MSMQSSTSPASSYEGAPSILGIGTAVPAHVRSQRDMMPFMAAAHGLEGAQERRLRVLYERTRIDTRHSCVPDFGRHWREFEFFARDPRLEPPPTTSRRMEWYRRHAPDLALRACHDLFSRPDIPGPEAVEHVFVVSCTGFFAPGMDVLLSQSLAVRPDAGRTLIGFQGCQGGLTALRLAEHLTRARPEACALVVCVELCTLHFQNEPTEENLLANALFSDGAAAVLVGGAKVPAPAVERPRLRIVQTRTYLQPDSLEEMVWTVGDVGFELRLSSWIPRLLSAGLPSFLADGMGVAKDDLRRLSLWAVHPGGAGILDGLEKTLELPPATLAASRNVLRRFGNMSSPTIYFVLREILDDPGAFGDGVALAFGPGLTIEGARFEKAGVAEEPRGERRAATGDVRGSKSGDRKA